MEGNLNENPSPNPSICPGVGSFEHTERRREQPRQSRRYNHVSRGKPLMKRNRDEHCKCFNGLQNRFCEKRIEYTQFNNGTHDGLALVLPCWGPQGFIEQSTPKTCDGYCTYTPEEIADREEQIEEQFLRHQTIRKAIIAECPRPGNGKLVCPCCGGTVSYSRALNGHVHARCSTKGCASWME